MHRATEQRLAAFEWGLGLPLLALLGFADPEIAVQNIDPMSLGEGMSAAFLLLGAGLFWRKLRWARRARQAAEQRTRDLEDLYDRAPCGYQLLDRRGVVLKVNDTELSWLGYSRQEVVGVLAFSDLIAPESTIIFASWFATLLGASEIQTTTVSLRRKNGTTLPVSVSALAVFDHDGQLLHIRTTLFDNTSSVRNGQDLDRIFMLSRDLLCVASSDGHFKRVNPAWEDRLGFTREELTAKPFLAFVHPDDHAATLSTFERQVAAGAEVVAFENRYRCKDGSYRVLQWAATTVLPEGLIYAAARDVTDRNQADQRIAALNRDLAQRAAQLEASNRQLESFSYSVSHDLRAPLRAIDGFSRVVEEEYGEKIGEEGCRLLGVISDNSHRMGLLIDDLLAFSRVGCKQLAASRVDMKQLVEDVLRDAITIDAPVSVRFVAKGLPEAWGDPALLRQVWSNLLSNAVKFSSRAQRPVAEIGGGDNGEETLYYVRDNGAGFDMRGVSKIFGVFQRLHSDAEFPGTGVGLAIVERIVTHHGGRAWAEGAVDEGATVHFALPKRCPD